MAEQLVVEKILDGAVTVEGNDVTISRPELLASESMDKLVRQAVFGEGAERETARWLIWELGQQAGVRAASIDELYRARGRGEVSGFTVPAINVRGASYLAHEAIDAGFYNIDVDTSTLVDISLDGHAEQQRANYETAVDIVRYIRGLEPKGVTISIGGEIGEVGTENSTVAELRAFMGGFEKTLRERGGDMQGLSKISVQSGTSHGGTVLPDGSIQDVNIDFDTLERLSKVSRGEYGLAGAVQHGASTLPDSAFDNFPRVQTAEIHLATNFQNMLYDLMPAELKDEMYEWLRTNAGDERKAKDSDEQFFYKTRKKALGHFKRRLWDLPADTKKAIAAAYDSKFEFLFSQLAVGGTADAVRKYVRAPEQHRTAPTGAGPRVAAAPDDPDAGE